MAGEKPHFYKLGAVDARFRCRRCHIMKSHEAYAPLHYVQPKARTLLGHFLHPLCNMCRKERQSKWREHPKYSREVFEYFNRRMASLRASGSSRSIPVAIDLDDLIGLWIDQDGKCALSGCELTVAPKCPGFKDPTSASVDRIDSAGIYDVSNVQLVCARVNVMKNDMTHQELLEWCQRILDRQARREDEILKVVA